MKNIIIAYPVKEIALKLRSMLENEGYHISFICARGSSVLDIASSLSEGVVICSAVLSDMTANVLADNLPCGFDVVSLSKGGRSEYSGNLISLSLPVNRSELFETVAMLVGTRSSFIQRNTHRSSDEEELISQAKHIIMSSRHISEMQAHKLLQSRSMKTGKRLIDLAKEIIYEEAM